MNEETSKGAEVTVLKVSASRLAAEETALFKEAVLKALKGSEGPLVLDFSAVDFMASSGLGALIGILKASEGRRVVICGLQPLVLDTFKVTRLDRVFDIYPDSQTACSALQAGATTS